MRVGTTPSRVLACLLVVGIMTAGTAQAASSPGPNAPLSAPQIATDSSLLDRDFIGELLLAAHDSSGYSGEWFDEDTRTLTFYWHGEVPESLVLQGQEGIPLGITVEWEQGEYSAVELSALASELWASDLDIESIEYASDGSGVTVSYIAEPASRKAAGRKALKSASSEVPSRLAGAITWSPVPATEVESADTRTTDTAPFDGGSRISNGTSSCSSGHTVQRDSTNTTGMLTAWHCSGGKNDVTWRVSGSGATLGKTTSLKSKGWDVQFIKGSGPFTQSIFWGGSDTGSKKSFASGMFYLPAPHPIGSTVTVSGGLSGNQTGKIIAMAEVDYLGSAQNGKPYYKVQATADRALAGNGDSGSPTVEVLSNGKLFPVGLYVALNTASAKPCQGVPDSSTRSCSRIGYVTPWYKIVDVLGVS